MDFIAGLVNKLFSLLLSPIEGMRPERAILAISLVTSVLMFYLYKWTSNQAALKAVQDRIKAYIIEIQLYRTDIYVMLRALGRVFLKNLTYMRLLLLPAVFLLAIVGLIIVQCYPRFEYRPILPGESFVVKAKLADTGGAQGSSHVNIDAPKGLTVETAGVAAPSQNEVGWRLRADAPGEYTIGLTSGAEKVMKSVTVSDRLVGISRTAGPFTLSGYFTDPLGTRLTGSQAFKSVTVEYPERDIRKAKLFGMDWIIYFFVVSFVAAVGLKFILKAS